MQCLNRNKTLLYYSLLEGQTYIKDSDGYDTGETRNTYAEPVKLYASISASKGQDVIELFGVNCEYDKTIIIDDIECPIDENTIVFIDKEPSWDETNKTLNNSDYIVVRVARSLNFIAIAVKKV